MALNAAASPEPAPSCEACAHTMRSAGAWVFECPACGFLSSTLTPGIGTGIDGLETLRRNNYERMLDRIDRLRPLKGARILEVGSAWGWFLAAAQRRGASAQGIEPEAGNAELARAAGLRVDIGFFPGDLTGNGLYDIIVFNDVFEHIPAPSRMVDKIAARVAPGGLLVLNCPSRNGVLFRLARALNALGAPGAYERLWQKGFSSPHVSYFNASNLKLLIEQRSQLREVARFSLPSISRDGLTKRVRNHDKGIASALTLAIIWCLSFAQALLPPDIEVNVFRKAEV